MSEQAISGSQIKSGAISNAHINASAAIAISKLTGSSADLLAAVTDETGTGLLVFNNGPTLVAPVLGTPASGTLTNCAGLPMTTGVTGTLPVGNGGTGLTAGTSGGIPFFSATNTLASSAALAANALVIGGGAGVAPSTTTTAANILTFLGTPTSANLAAAVTDETGSGSLVFGTSPTFTTDAKIPLVIGGTGTTSTLQLRSTSGVGTTGADIIFQVGNNGATEAMRILNSGFAGIGTTSPGAMLQVNPSATGTIGQIIKGFSGQTADLSQFQNSSGTVLARVNASGYFGIGATTPSYRLDVVGTASSADSSMRLWFNTTNTAGVYNSIIMPVFNGSSGFELRHYGNSTDGYSTYLMGGQSSSNIYITAGAAVGGTSKHLSVHNSGYVGVNTGSTTPGGQFMVIPSGTGVVGAIVQAYSGQTADLSQWQNSSGTVLVRVSASGYLGIGTSPAHVLDVTPVLTSQTTQINAVRVDHDITQTADVSTVAGLSSVIRLRGSVAQTNTGNGVNGVSAAAFSYNTNSVQQLASLRADTRNLSTGVVVSACGLLVNDVANSGGGSITTAYGVRILAQTGGTTIYGLSSEVASGSGFWNIYAQGTASNYFAGSVGIGTTSISATLHVSGATPVYINTTSAGQIALLSSGTIRSYISGNSTDAIALGNSSNATYFRMLQNGTIGVNTTTPGAQFQITTGATGTVGEIIKGYSGQTADLLQIQNSSATVMACFTSAGYLLLNRTATIGNNAFLEIDSGSTAGSRAVIETASSTTGSAYWRVSNTNTAHTSLIAFGETTGDASTPAYIARRGSTHASASEFLFVNANNAAMRFHTNNTERMCILGGGSVGFGTASPTAVLHLKAGTATANTAPLKFTTGTNLTAAEAGVFEYNNTPHFTNSDATRRHIVLAASATKTTAAAPYTNDGYITVNIGGTDVKVMTTA